MRKLVFICCLFWGAMLNAQHVPLQSQYMFNTIALNPAFTGSENSFSVVSSFRAQWIGFPGAPMTESITAHAPLKDMKSSVGVQVFADQIGVTSNTGIFGSYSYRAKFENSTMVFGASAGINFIKSYFSKLKGNDEFDATIMNDTPLGVLPDFSFGMHYFGKRWFVSMSAPMFLTHQYEDGKFKLRNNMRNYNIMLGGGYLFNLKNDMKLRPSVLLKYKADSRLQLDMNLMMVVNNYFETGISFRTQEALVALFKISPNDQLSFMYSFGLPISPIIRHSYGSHEISLKYNFMYKTPITSPRFLGF